MRLIIDIGHPAHVHLFKNFAWEMQNKGHHTFFTCRENEFEKYLLEKYGFEFKSFGKKYNTKYSKLWGLLKFDFKEFIQGIKFNADLFLSHGSMYAAHAASILRKPHIALEDSGNWEQIKLYLPATKVVLTPKVLNENLGEKQIRYNGYHELAYLHPKRFEKDNANTSENNIMLRFVSWQATHDYGHSGLDPKQKDEIINYLSTNYKIQISSQYELPKAYKKYQISIKPDDIHQLLASSTLVISEGATIASEAGVLGVPSIYVSSIERSYCTDQQRYGLVYNYKHGTGVLEKIKDILQIHDLRSNWQERRQKMLEDKIDVTAFLVWFVENYPHSVKIMRANPNYQYNFK